MVKVVRIEPDKTVVKEIVCRHCGATLSYTPIDVQSEHGTDYSGGPDGREWITCANCSRQVTIRSW